MKNKYIFIIPLLNLYQQ